MGCNNLLLKGIIELYLVVNIKYDEATLRHLLI